MNTLLIFFALPIATIILSAVLEKILNCPLCVASVAFAIYLIVTFSAFDTTFLIATIIYTIIALITAIIVRFIINSINDNDSNECMLNSLGNLSNNTTNNNNSCGCGCRRRA